MANRIKLAFLFLIACALVSISWPLNPPADAGGSDKPSLTVGLLPRDSVARRRTLTQPKAALPHPGPLPRGEGEITEGEEKGGSGTSYVPIDPVATPTGRDTDKDPPAQLRTLTRPLSEGEEKSGTDSHPSAAAGLTDADFTAHVEQLKKKLPSEDFTIVVQKPFVVIGDEPADAVKEYSVRTVKWAVDKLKQEYFSKDPEEIIDIWLFKNKASYERNAQLLFGARPTTPFGYYSKTHKALVMDISTGGGTLVHEIVHPFIEANFPNCPPWLNEGLGSLYEQSGEVRGRIHGFTNWRLRGLQADIKAGRVPAFRKLLGMSVPEFYNFESGSHYAQSRYLLYYLQQKGLLKKFYLEFFANQKTDPTGYHTLARVLGTRDLRIFKFKWELWVMDLTQGYEVR
jgi:hypothetical protein